MRARAELVLAWLLCGCTADDPLTLAIDDYAEAVAETSAALCRCPAAFGFASVEACMRDPELGPLDEDERSCMADVLASDEPAALLYLECMTVAEHDLSRCLVATPDCVDMPAAVFECVDRHDVDAQQCDALAEGLYDALLPCSSASRVELLDRLR